MALSSLPTRVSVNKRRATKAEPLEHVTRKNAIETRLKEPRARTIYSIETRAALNVLSLTLSFDGTKWRRRDDKHVSDTSRFSEEAGELG